jgi:uncharacterized membrane protein YbaN (DUF454 family)
MAVVRNRALRSVLLVLGWIWVGIAFIGIIAPIIPTTGPIILAAFLFSKSSERFDDWLVNNRLFGSIVRGWRGGEGFTVRAKFIAVTAIVISFGITTVFALGSSPMVVRAGMWLLAFAIAAYVVTRPTKTRTVAATPTTV